ncbi:MAG: hypothetical protein AAFX87_15485 [Bacteroidota bacterium]
MEEDKLKKWVDEDKTRFDIYETDVDGLWGEIENRLDSKDKADRRGRFTVLWRAAAVVVLAFGLGWFFAKSGGDSQVDNNGFALHEISPELAETEFYYSSMVNEKLQIIQASGADINQEVYDNLAVLDSVYQELKLDLQDNADNEEVVSAMIQHYRIKLEILEQILEEITDKDDDEDEEVRI